MIRRARPDESVTLLRIQREAAVAAFAHIFPPDRYPFPDDGVRADWQNALADPEIEIYVAEIDGEPAASVAVGHGFLRNLYVLPQHQGTGVGSTSLLLARMMNQRCRSIVPGSCGLSGCRDATGQGQPR